MGLEQVENRVRAIVNGQWATGNWQRAIGNCQWANGNGQAQKTNRLVRQVH